MIAALYSSRKDGTKEFYKSDTNFGWSTIEAVYRSDLCRAQQGISRRVPGLKYSHIVRDSWTRLNVLPAKIMQVRSATVCDYGIHLVFNYSNLTCLPRFVRWPRRRTNVPNGLMSVLPSILKPVI